MDDMNARSLRKNRDILTDVLNRMGLATVLHPDATPCESVLVLSGTLFVELVGSVAQAQNEAADRDDTLKGAAAFVQGWESAFAAMNAARGDANPVGPRLQLSALSVLVELVAKVTESYIDPDRVDPRVFAAAQAIEAGADLLALTTFDPDDHESAHTYTHNAYEELEAAHKALFYSATHQGHYTEEH